jgi:hypothetical protein
MFSEQPNKKESLLSSIFFVPAIKLPMDWSGQAQPAIPEQSKIVLYAPPPLPPNEKDV